MHPQQQQQHGMARANTVRISRAKSQSSLRATASDSLLSRFDRSLLRCFKLRVLLRGAISGVENIVYISLVLLLIVYLYAVAGVVFFRDNDPFHWKTLAMAMTTLCRLASLDDWFDVYSINYYGCATYAAGIYTANATLAAQEAGMHLCHTPVRQPWISTFFFFTFTDFLIDESDFILLLGFAIAVKVLEGMLLRVR